MANQYDEFDNEDDFNDDGGPSNLRKALKRAERDKKEMAAQLEELRSSLRERSVKDVLESQGVNSKIARFIPNDISTPEQVAGWLDEYADVFNIQRAASQEEDSSEMAGQQARMNSVTRGAVQDSAKPADLLKKVQSATSLAELNELTGNQPSRFQR